MRYSLEQRDRRQNQCPWERWCNERMELRMLILILDLDTWWYEWYDRKRGAVHWDRASSSIQAAMAYCWGRGYYYYCYCYCYSFCYSPHHLRTIEVDLLPDPQLEGIGNRFPLEEDPFSSSRLPVSCVVSVERESFGFVYGVEISVETD